MLSIFEIIVFSIILFVLFITNIIIKKVFNYKQDNHLIEKFQDYQNILLFYMEKAFDIVYKDQILIFSIEATKVSENELDNSRKDFCRLVIKFLGPTLYNKLIKLSGDEETFLFNLVEYFTSRYEEDEIREASLSNIMSNEDE